MVLQTVDQGVHPTHGLLRQTRLDLNPAQQVSAGDAAAAYQFEMDLVKQRWELKAAIRRELGDEEIARRVEDIQARWRTEQAQLRAYRQEVKAARERRDLPPPHPVHNPDGWRQWEYKRAYYRQSHN